MPTPDEGRGEDIVSTTSNSGSIYEDSSDSIQNIRWILEGSLPQYERTWKKKPLVCQLLLSSALLGSYVFLG